MNLFTLKYFSKSDGISGSDFENQDKIVKINLDFLLSLSNLEEFRLPFSGDFRGKYVLVTMSNNDRYYIREEEYKKLEHAI